MRKSTERKKEKEKKSGRKQRINPQGIPARIPPPPQKRNETKQNKIQNYGTQRESRVASVLSRCPCFPATESDFDNRAPHLPHPLLPTANWIIQILSKRPPFPVIVMPGHRFAKHALPRALFYQRHKINPKERGAGKKERKKTVKKASQKLYTQSKNKKKREKKKQKQKRRGRRRRGGGGGEDKKKRKRKKRA